jgi:phospholipid/cholesterol/gamma-HCH transport system substrate-binding protein
LLCPFLTPEKWTNFASLIKLQEVKPNKMNKETKIGIMAAVCIAGLVWGYMFLKGKNILSRSLTVYAVFEKVEDLPVSAPVLVSGLQVGTVQAQYLKDGNPNQIVVVMDIERKTRLPKDAVVVIQATSLMGGKSIRLDYKSACTDNCVESGDTLAGRHEGLLNTLLPIETLNSYIDNVRENIGGIMDTIDFRLGKEGSPSAESVQDFRAILHNLAALSQQLNQLVAAMSGNLRGVSKDLNVLSSNLAGESKALSQIIDNVNSITTQLSATDLQGTVANANETISSLNATVKQFDKSAVQLEQSLSKLNSSEGSLGLLLNDKTLYQNLEKSTRQLDLLMQDMRLNPKRYVHLSVFGKKQKSYEFPSDDPAEKVQSESLEKE